jgi:hypothetical protein
VYQTIPSWIHFLLRGLPGVVVTSLSEGHWLARYIWRSVSLPGSWQNWTVAIFFPLCHLDNETGLYMYVYKYIVYIKYYNHIRRRGIGLIMSMVTKIGEANIECIFSVLTALINNHILFDCVTFEMLKCT